MTLWDRWVRQPQSLWLRKALFQVHLWTGIGIGLYVVVACVTGSAIVFNNELAAKLTATPLVITVSGDKMTREALEAAALRAHPGLAVSQFFPSRSADRATEIWLDNGGKTEQRLFDPYTGEDLGDAVPYGFRFISWLVDAHVNLLAGETGRIVNGAGSVLLTLLCLSGAVVWWPGIKTWRRSLTIQKKANWKRLNWDLHSAVGFWTFAIVFLFALSGDYLVFPKPFAMIIDPNGPTDEFPFGLVEGPRLGDDILRWLARLHFGRFAGWPVKALWVVLGLAPVFLFVTGALMWWNRVVRRNTLVDSTKV